MHSLVYGKREGIFQVLTGEEAHLEALNTFSEVCRTGAGVCLKKSLAPTLSEFRPTWALFREVYMPTVNRAPTLKPSQLRHVLNVTRATSRHPERDVLAILMTHCCGLRVTELARLEIRDVLLPSGRLRDEAQLRAEITKNCRSRLIFLTVPALREAIEEYLGLHLQKRLGAGLEASEYRGLYPESALLLTHRGGGFELVKKVRKLPSGFVGEYWAADALEARFRGLYKAAGINTSSHAGRRTFASTLIRNGTDLEQVAIILGHQSIDVTAAYIEVSRKTLRAMYEYAL